MKNRSEVRDIAKCKILIFLQHAKKQSTFFSQSKLCISQKRPPSEHLKNILKQLFCSNTQMFSFDNRIAMYKKQKAYTLAGIEHGFFCSGGGHNDH
jgi:hypothetical protein